MQHRGLFSSSSHQRGGWACTRIWEGTQLWQLTPSDPGVISLCVASCSADKAERKKEGACSEWWDLPCRVTDTWRNSALLRVAEEGMNSSFLFAYVCGFCLPINLCLSQPPSFPLLPFLFFPPSHCWGGSSCQGWVTSWGWTMTRALFPFLGCLEFALLGSQLPPPLLLPTADVLKSFLRVWSRLELILRDLPRFPQWFYGISRI